MSKHRAYFMTWNNPTADDITLWKNYLNDNALHWAWQVEKGESGTEHIQAVFRFKAQRSFSKLKKELPKPHFEPAKDWKSAVKYCQKIDTRVNEGDIHVDDKEKPSIVVADPLEGVEKKGWQKVIDGIISAKPSDRTIYWFHDSQGGLGKTTYAKHLAINYSPNFIYLSGKASDIKSAISTMVEKGDEPQICLFDFTRSMEEYISYEALESVKNGIFFNGKYESSMVLFNIPHVIVFANFLPELRKLSADRWDVRSIYD